MNIEVKNFYLVEKNDQLLRGSLHVVLKLGEYELDIRGVFACRRENRWIFRLPFGRSKTEAGEFVSFPSISFSDKQLNKALINAIYEQAPSFIEASSSEKEDRVILPQNEKKPFCGIKPLEKAKISTGTREMALIEKANTRHNLPNKTWVDIPAKKPVVRKTQINRG